MTTPSKKTLEKFATLYGGREMHAEIAEDLMREACYEADRKLGEEARHSEAWGAYAEAVIWDPARYMPEYKRDAVGRMRLAQLMTVRKTASELLEVTMKERSFF